MFKVICINNKPWVPGHDWKVLHMLSEWEEYTVVEVVKNGGYILAETREAQYECRQALQPGRFIPLSDIDERERLEAYQREQLAAEGKLFEAVAAILEAEEEIPQDAWERNWTAIEERLNAAHG